MNWEKLLSTQRTGQDALPDSHHDRTQFQRDFDRLIFSSPFRRMQDKTQVFPLPGSVFVHNRLTHSLEVASVGRSMGNNISRFLKEEIKVNSPLVDELGAVTAAACLAHDMGNPPFGHSGEKAISHFFKSGEGKKYRDEVKDEAVWNDFVDFEGNANAFRLLTHQFNGRRKGGFRMTYTTIASIVKYPYASGDEKLKKYGYFQSELTSYHHIAQTLGIPEISNSPSQYARHPLVYLVEAADDICYQIMDIEDAHKLGILSFEHTKKLLLAFFADDSATLNRLHEVCASVTDLNEQIAFLRASVIGKLVELSTAIFIENHDQIMRGEFSGSLVKHLKGDASEAMNRCAKTGFELIYRHPSVVEIEISGFKILGSLLKEFTRAVMNPKDGYSGLLLPFIPQQYKVEETAPAALRIQTVLDFVSGMTDVYALDLFRKINGIGLADKRFN
ncbi:MAG TPA: dNTP triphosphohydrolase [Marinilabiliaceae bacterium]|nr:dNTP triphosphohydrolase [Marinilabiliaceae bacterium]